MTSWESGSTLSGPSRCECLRGKGWGCVCCVCGGVREDPFVFVFFFQFCFFVLCPLFCLHFGGCIGLYFGVVIVSVLLDYIFISNTEATQRVTARERRPNPPHTKRQKLHERVCRPPVSLKHGPA